MANNNSAAPYSSSSAPASSSSSMPPRPPPQPSAASSSSSVATIGRECAKCLSYLTRALDGGTATASSSSRPATLLRALGVISPIDGRRTNIAENNENGSGVDRGSNSSSNNKIYELTPNRRGVMIRLEDHHAHNKYNNNSSSNEGTANVENVRDSQHRESMVMVGSSGDNSHQQQKQPQHKEPIHRRLSNAASQLASNITSGQNNNTGIVLTTSPLSSSSPSSHNASTKDSSITTITIECSPCGSDTRAEASARAYVRGPDPLGIVLCSNRLASQREIEEVLVHELVHIYDVHVRQMDLRDCKQLAYSEVRAAREAECGNRMTSFTTNICAKDRAIVATRNMFPDEGKKCVCDVFDAAVKDYAPFLVGSGGGSSEDGVGGGVPRTSSNNSTFSSATFASKPSPLPPRQSDR